MPTTARVPDASYPVLSIPGLNHGELVDLRFLLAGADEVERLVVAPVLLPGYERVDRHHPGLVLRAHKHVLLIGLLQEQQHVTAGEVQCYKESTVGLYSTGTCCTTGIRFTTIQRYN
jgi:hypothetical protein